jgi:hypothetical protein
MADSLAISSLSLESAPTSPPTRYFDLIPPELVRYILVYVDSHPQYDQFERFARKDTLMVLCLTSRLLKEIAQPLLLGGILRITPFRSDLLERLLNGNSSEALIAVRTVYLRELDVARQRPWLERLAQNAVNFRRLDVSRCNTDLGAFVGTSK